MAIKFGIARIRAACSHAGAKHAQVGEIRLSAMIAFIRGTPQSRVPETVLEMDCVDKSRTPIFG